MSCGLTPQVTLNNTCQSSTPLPAGHCLWIHTCIPSLPPFLNLFHIPIFSNKTIVSVCGTAWIKIRCHVFLFFTFYFDPKLNLTMMWDEVSFAVHCKILGHGRYTRDHVAIVIYYLTQKHRVEWWTCTVLSTAWTIFTTGIKKINGAESRNTEQWVT